MERPAKRAKLDTPDQDARDTPVDGHDEEDDMSPPAEEVRASDLYLDTASCPADTTALQAQHRISR